MDNKELAIKLVELVGGKENVLKAANCMTRLRLTVKDAAKVQNEAIKETEGVLGRMVDANTYQVVLGPGKVKKVMDSCANELGLSKQGQEANDWKRQ